MVKCNDDVDGIKKPFFKVFRKSTDTIYGHIILAAVTCASYLPISYRPETTFQKESE